MAASAVDRLLAERSLKEKLKGNASVDVDTGAAFMPWPSADTDAVAVTVQP